MTRFRDEYRQRYGWGGGWDAPIRRSECCHCGGTGRAAGDVTDPTECGFCEADEPNA